VIAGFWVTLSDLLVIPSYAILPSSVWATHRNLPLAKKYGKIVGWPFRDWLLKTRPLVWLADSPVGFDNAAAHAGEAHVANN
jgi:hypothetical protein